MPTITLYTDGSGTVAGYPGGWGCVLLHGENRKEISGGMQDATNNRAEITAAIMGLRAIRVSHWNVHVITDSEHVRDGINVWVARWKKFNWKRSVNSQTPLKNLDLWQALDVELSRNHVTASWVKGHAKTAENLRCDKLAGMERRKLMTVTV